MAVWPGQTGMIGVVPRSMMALWQRRVSKAPSAITVPIGSSAAIWPSRFGNTGLSPSQLGVNDYQLTPVASRLKYKSGY